MASHREPAWLTAMLDQRLALIKETVEDPNTAFGLMNMVMTPLTEPREGATQEEYERWDQTCDNCGAYVPGELFTGHVVRFLDAVQVIVSFGVCTPCREASIREVL
jgi:hypothetical protein